MNLQEAYEELDLNYCNDKYLTLKEVERIYKKLAKQYHIDVINIPKYLQESIKRKLQRLNEAMEIIRENLEMIEEELKLKLYIKGIEYYEDKNYEEAIEAFQKIGEMGEINAQLFLGACYYLGYGVKQNYKEAFYWYEKSAKQGNNEAQFKLGEFYEKGLGVEQSYKKAMEYYKEIAKTVAKI